MNFQNNLDINIQNEVKHEHMMKLSMKETNEWRRLVNKSTFFHDHRLLIIRHSRVSSSAFTKQ